MVWPPRGPRSFLSPHCSSLFLLGLLPQIDVGAYAAGLEQKTQQVQLQLQSLEQQIAVLKHQYAATPPGQRPILAQRLKMMMTQRAGLQRQAMSYQSNQMNVQQSAWRAAARGLALPAHGITSPLLPPPSAPHPLPRSPSTPTQWTLPGSRQR